MATLTGSIRPQFRTIDGLRIRFAESEPRERDALLLSPWPETVHAFDQVWDRLATDTHLVAVELPGFGYSERRDDLLAPRAMGAFVIRIADVFGLEHPHGLGPDVGTPAILFAAADHPGRFRSLVVGSGGAAFPLELGGRLNEWVTAPNVDAYRAIDGRQIVTGTMARIERYQLPDAVREDYLTAYEGDRFAESMRYVRSYPRELEVLGTLLPDIHTPVQIIGGLWDSAVPPINHRYLHERLPNSALELLDAGHFTWEDAPSDYADIVMRWWRGTAAVERTDPVGVAAANGSVPPVHVADSASDVAETVPPALVPDGGDAAGILGEAEITR